MKAYTEKTLYDKSSWSPGVWRGEPDVASWTDESTGYRCLVTRHEEGGHWCGYVGIPPSHPSHGAADPATVAVGAPGGVTYVGPAVATSESNADDVSTWWIGFGAVATAQPKKNIEGPYMDLPWIREHTIQLAYDLQRLTAPPPAPPAADPIPPPEATSSATAGPGEAAATPKAGDADSQTAVGAGVTVKLETPEVSPDVVAQPIEDVAATDDVADAADGALNAVTGVSKKKSRK